MTFYKKTRMSCKRKDIIGRNMGDPYITMCFKYLKYQVSKITPILAVIRFILLTYKCVSAVGFKPLLTVSYTAELFSLIKSILFHQYLSG